MPLCHSRIKTFGDFIDLCDFFFINHIPYKKELFAVPGLNEEQAAYILQAMIWHMDRTLKTGEVMGSILLREVLQKFLVCIIKKW